MSVPRKCIDCGKVGEDTDMAIVSGGYIHEECAATRPAYQFRL